MIKIGLMIVVNCSDSPDALLSLIEEIKLDYKPPDKVVGRGRQLTFSDLSFLLLAVVAVVTKTYSDSELHRLLTKDEALREALLFERVPHRTRIGRRLKRLVPVAEEQISRCGQVILSDTRKAADEAVISAIDGRMYRASGPRWHKKDRQAGEIPAGLRAVDTESSWSKSGYRGLGAGLPDSHANIGVSGSGAAVCRVAAELGERSQSRVAGTRHRPLANNGGAARRYDFWQRRFLSRL